LCKSRFNSKYIIDWWRFVAPSMVLSVDRKLLRGNSKGSRILGKPI
jgi:hypothetical protein